MDDAELFTKLLGITAPWRVTRVSVNVPAERIDVWVEELPGTTFPCAVRDAPVPVYDHTPEQEWRHLDTCQCQTYVHAVNAGLKFPRCAGRFSPRDGARELDRLRLTSLPMVPRAGDAPDASPAPAAAQARAQHPGPGAGTTPRGC